MNQIKWLPALMVALILFSLEGANADTGIDGSANSSSSFTLTGLVTLSNLTVSTISWSDASFQTTAAKVLYASGTITSQASNTSGTTYVDATGLVAKITPTSGSNWVQITGYINLLADNGTGSSGATMADVSILRNGATRICENLRAMGYRTTVTPETDLRSSVPLNCIDNPATTSLTTYQVQFRRSSAASFSNTFYVNDGGAVSTLTLLEVVPKP